MSALGPIGDPVAEGKDAVILNRFECDRLLRSNRVGRIGFVADGWPTVLPVNYVMDGDSVVLRTDGEMVLGPTVRGRSRLESTPRARARRGGVSCSTAMPSRSSTRTS
jgi:nitroimidazol reductase NimA-like FMN-containing flavoprotein (pyridoxamine 5'-phosphate oxidase superfamily)